MILLYDNTGDCEEHSRITRDALRIFMQSPRSGLAPYRTWWREKVPSAASGMPLDMVADLSARKTWGLLGNLLAADESRRDIISVSVAGETTQERRAEIAGELLRGILRGTAPRIVFFSFPRRPRIGAVLSALFLHAIAHPPSDAETPDEVLCAAKALAPRRRCFAALPEEDAASAELHQLDTMRVSGGRIIAEVFA